jgi:apolipoprotein N-acyltransferase
MSLPATSAFRPEPHGRPSVTWPRALGASLLGPVALYLAFPKIDWGILAFIALVPLFLLWSKSSWKQALWWGLFSGVMLFMLLFDWMTHSLRDFIGGWWLLGLVLLSLVQGINIAIMALATSLVCRGQFRTAAIFAAPAIWLLAEAWRTRGSLGVPFGTLGVTAVHIPWLLPVAAYGGASLLTALIALVNGALAGIIGGTRSARRTGVAVLALVALLVVIADVAYAKVVPAPPTLRVAVAQGDIAQSDKWSPAVFARTIQVYAGLTRRAAARGAKIVVWPETAVTSWPLQSPLLLETLAGIARQSKVWIFTGMLDRPSPVEYYNAMLDLTPRGAPAGVYRKRMLVPFAEYLPFEHLLTSFPLMNEVSRFRPGPGPHLLPAAGLLWGVLICYESAFAPYARATANAGADAIIVATDDAWFGGTSGPDQHADFSILQAVSTGRWIVRGADTGISMIVTPKGNVVTRLPTGVQGIIVADIGRGFETPYDRLGNLWLFVLAVLAIGAGFVRSRTLQEGWRSRRGAP